MLITLIMTNIHRISSKNWSSKSRGEHAEMIVRDYFLKLNYQISFHRKKIFGVEFDWGFKKNDEMVYIEVKSVKSHEFYLNRWPWKQKERFKRVSNILASQKKSTFYLAFVNYEDEIQLFKVGIET